MISRHLASEHLKQRRQEEEAETKFVVDRRKHANRVTRTRYAVFRDRSLARRDRELVEARMEFQAMLGQARMERRYMRARVLTSVLLLRPAVPIRRALQGCGAKGEEGSGK